jgi:Radical SAM superfamily
MADTNLMPIPGPIDPVPLPRADVVEGVTPREDGRVDLIGLPRPRIAVLFEAAGLDRKQAKLRAKQVFHWLYHRGVTDFEAMTDIAKTMRPWLAERFAIGRPGIVEAQHSTDGTRKWLLRTADGHDFEMVFIPDADRGTLCVSSQVGCTLNCKFCHTGTMRLVRNLTAGEIVGQVMLARDALGEWPNGGASPALSIPLDEDDEDEDEGSYTSDGRLLTNIVMMGMGEPLYNFDNVRDALKLVMDGDGLALSKRRITLSTSGIVPQMAKCGHQGRARRDRPDQPQVRHRGAAAGLRRLSGRQQRAAHHLRIRHAEGQERPRRGRARTRPPAQALQAARQGEPDSVQSLAGHRIRVLDAGAHPPVLGDHLRRRHLGAGAHSARARYRCGVRPVEDRRGEEEPRRARPALRRKGSGAGLIAR